MSHFGRNIKKIRTVKNLTQQNFADLFNLKRATLGAYEEGRSEPKIENIIKVANYFSISIDDLLTRDLTVNELLKFKGDITTGTSKLTQEYFTDVPCITERNYSDYILNHDSQSFVNEMPFLRLPIKDDRPVRGYTINNLEMTSHNKGLFPNDVVVGHQHPLNKIKAIIDGTLVLVLTEQKLILRRMYILKNEVALKADHPNIDDTIIDQKSVKELWIIKYAFLNRIPNIKNNLEDQLSMLSQELDKINQKLDPNS